MTRYRVLSLVALIVGGLYASTRILTLLENMDMTNQEKLNSIAAQLVAVEANIRQDIADLKAANPTLDFSALENSVAALGTLDAENPPPPVP